MPRYDYKCSECLSVFTARHSIKDTVDECKHCGSENTVEKIPTSFLTIKKETAGKVVKSHIEEFKQDLRQEKKDLQNQEYKP
tara:strand:- start:361 stop:606 length:246 start_codon:yes stop_codon:yes gene_type:complete